jgi:hypothetical protein
MAKEQLPDNESRLGQIREGAGLEDSRVNQEFVDFIRKWSTPVLLVAAAIALGYFLYNKRIEAREARVSEAYAQLNQSSATANPSPDALRRIAEDYNDVPGVRLMATLTAADQYLAAVQRGVRPGTPLDAAGEPENPEDYLSEEDRERFLAEAQGLYQTVWDQTQGSPALSIYTLESLYGLAAVAESRGDIEGARNAYDQASALAEKMGYAEHAQIAKQRLDEAGTIRHVSLPSKADLPEPPEPEVIEDPEIDVEIGPQLPEGGEPELDLPDVEIPAGAGDGAPGGEGDSGEGESGGQEAGEDTSDDGR